MPETDAQAGAGPVAPLDRDPSGQELGDVLSRIPGRELDKAAKPKPHKVADLEDRRAWVGVAWGAYERFRYSRSPLMAAGTAYYGFIAMFSLLAFVYGLAAILSADAIADFLTSSLETALPGLVGDDGIDPETLARIGRASSLVGLVLLPISGAAVMSAASESLHQIYGAPPDGRNPAARRLHLLMWLVVVGPLVMLSYSLAGAVTGFGARILDDLSILDPLTRGFVVVVASLLTFALDVGIAAILLGRLGGVAPSRRSLLPGALVAASVITVFKAFMARVVEWSVDRPQFGSFAVPVTLLVVLWFQSMALYAGACVTAASAHHRECRSG